MHDSVMAMNILKKLDGGKEPGARLPPTLPFKGGMAIIAEVTRPRSSPAVGIEMRDYVPPNDAKLDVLKRRKLVLERHRWCPLCEKLCAKQNGTSKVWGLTGALHKYAGQKRGNGKRLEWPVCVKPKEGLSRAPGGKAKQVEKQRMQAAKRVVERSINKMKPKESAKPPKKKKKKGRAFRGNTCKN